MALAAAGWIWRVVRDQHRLNQISGAGALTRLDAFGTQTTFLAFLVLGAASIAGLRLLANYIQDQSSGSISGVEVGDPLYAIGETDE
jgi:hypothetical protein